MKRRSFLGSLIASVFATKTIASEFSKEVTQVPPADLPQCQCGDPEIIDMFNDLDDDTYDGGVWSPMGPVLRKRKKKASNIQISSEKHGIIKMEYVKEIDGDLSLYKIIK